MLNANECDSIIEHEILCLTPEDNKDEVLIEYSDYIGKLGGFSDNHLWEAIISQPIN